MTTQTLNDIEQRFKARGARLTPPRRLVLQTLLNKQKALTAYEIVDIIGDVKPMTVYRALDFLTAQGVVHRIESLNAYVSCAESHCAHRDSQFTVCDSCGAVAEIHNHTLDHQIAAALAQSTFKIKHKKLEIHGLCANCQ